MVTAQLKINLSSLESHIPVSKTPRLAMSVFSDSPLSQGPSHDGIFLVVFQSGVKRILSFSDGEL